MYYFYIMLIFPSFLLCDLAQNKLGTLQTLLHILKGLTWASLNLTLQVMRFLLNTKDTLPGIIED